MIERDWYKKWFGDEYLAVYAHRDEKEAQQLVQLIFKNLILKPQAKILDLCCGPGRHVSIFADLNFQVCGIDLSATLLRKAKKNIKNSKNARFIQADMRRLPISSKFDLVLNLFTSFGYFDTDDENIKVLNQIYHVLKKNGIFVLDYFNSAFVQKNLIPKHKNRLGEVVVEQERFIKDSRVQKKINIIKDDKKSTFYESVKMYQPDEIFSMLKSVGLKISKIFGNYDGQVFNEDSPRLLIFGEKGG